nr:hypothetical protein [Thermoflexibacter sp.]
TKDFCNWAALPQSYPIESGSDIDIILKMRHINGLTDGFGLMLWQDDSNHYTFEYQNNGKARYNIYENSTYTYIGDFKSTNIISNENSPSVIQKIEIRGSAVKYFVNNFLVDSFELKDYLTINNIALRVCGEQKVAFDELQVIPK